MNGTGVLKDQGLAAKWLSKAADQGHRGAMLEAAKLYTRSGSRVPRSPRLALQYIDALLDTHGAEISQGPGEDRHAVLELRTECLQHVFWDTWSRRYFPSAFTSVAKTVLLIGHHLQDPWVRSYHSALFSPLIPRHLHLVVGTTRAMDAHSVFLAIPRIHAGGWGS